MLELHSLDAFYGRAQVLFGLDLSVEAGEVVALLGRNGAGKSTTLKAILGLGVRRQGRLRFAGQDLLARQAYEAAQLGIGYVPEDRRIFADLSVGENLAVGARGESRWDRGRLLELFPELAALLGRRAGSLSGGEQQMLALARTLATDPRLLLLDEPSEGLAPLVVQRMAEAVESLKSDGLAILLAEQNLRFADRLTDRAYVLESGHLVAEGPLSAIRADDKALKALAL